MGPQPTEKPNAARYVGKATLFPSRMTLTELQADVRRAYMRGAPGMVVSGVVWLITAWLAQRGEVRTAMIALFLGGILIFPLGSLVVRLAGGSPTLPAKHPMTALGMQSAFIMPFGWPLVIAAGMVKPGWYFAAASLLVAIHYFPFITLYGMRHYGVVAALLLAVVSGALWLAPTSVTASAWGTAAVELVCGIWIWRGVTERGPVATGPSAPASAATPTDQ